MRGLTISARDRSSPTTVAISNTITTTSASIPKRETTHQDDTWEGQPYRYSDEAIANELNEWLEEAMDVDHLTPIIDMTEDELITAGIDTWALE